MAQPPKPANSYGFARIRLRNRGECCPPASRLWTAAIINVEEVGSPHKPLRRAWPLMSTLSALIALSLLPIWLWRLISERLRSGESPGLVFDRLLVERWADEPEKGASIRARAAAAIAQGSALGLTPIAWSDAAYPPALATIVDPPPVLWMRGLAAALDRPAVAIVGSRAGSPYALAVAERLAAGLFARGVGVVSGLARGGDSAGPRGALWANGGATI